MSDINYIQTVRTSVQSNFRFLLRIDDIPFAMISSVTRPSPQFETPKTFQLLNWKFKQPGAVVTWQDVSFKIVESFDNEKFDSVAGILLNTYKQLGYDNPNQVAQNAPFVKDMSKRSLINSIGTVKIETITPDGDVYETWELYNAFVSKIAFDGHQYGGAQVLGASVSLTYDWAELTYKAASGRETVY
tara:strand:- start:383 stop:946 length:564 start_codon:yes stop_codon:yes gene_type:complete